jgi:5-methylcytosine-specific restriction endonuclease McrA
MNNIFKNKISNNVITKIHTLKDIFNLPCKIYANTRYIKNDKKIIALPKIIKTNTYFKYNKNKNKNKKNIQKETFHHHSKETIPKRIRELVWTTNNGETFSHKCYVSWCDNTINVFNFQVGHDIPESKGGTLDIDNLKPICSNCNLSMSNKYTIKEWSQLITTTKKNSEQNIVMDNDQNIEKEINNDQNIVMTKPKPKPKPTFIRNIINKLNFH